MRSPMSGLIFLCRSTSSSTGRSVRAQDEAGALWGVGEPLLLEREPSVTVHRVGDVDEQGVRDGIPRCG